MVRILKWKEHSLPNMKKKIKKQHIRQLIFMWCLEYSIVWAKCLVNLTTTAKHIAYSFLSFQPVTQCSCLCFISTERRITISLWTTWRRRGRSGPFPTPVALFWRPLSFIQRSWKILSELALSNQPPSRYEPGTWANLFCNVLHHILKYYWLMNIFELKEPTFSNDGFNDVLQFCTAEADVYVWLILINIKLRSPDRINQLL